MDDRKRVIFGPPGETMYDNPEEKLTEKEFFQFENILEEFALKTKASSK